MARSHQTAKTKKIDQENLQVLTPQDLNFVEFIQMHKTEIPLGMINGKNNFVNYAVSSIRKQFDSIVNEAQEKLAKKQNVDTLLHRVHVCTSIVNQMLPMLLEANHQDLALAIGKVMRNYLLDLQPIVKECIDAKLVNSQNMKASVDAVLVDINFMLIKTSISLKQPHRTLAYIDETLSALDNTLNDNQTLGLTRIFLHKTAIDQFLAINDLENAIRFLDKTLRIMPTKWQEDADFVKNFSTIVKELLKKKTPQATDKATEYCERMINSKKPNLVKFGEQCLDILSKRKQKENQGNKNTAAKSNTKVQPEMAKTTALDTMKVLPDVKQTPTDSEKREPIGNSTLNILSIVAEPEPVDVKEKVKTRKPANEGKQEVENKPVLSQAEKLGFSKSFANEKIYALRSDLIPEGTFYAYYPQSNIDTYQLKPGLHEKNIQILQDGKIGADGNRVRYNKKKKDSFKVGKKRSDSRFFSRVKEETVVDGKRRVLLSFEAPHDHKSQQSEYDDKPKIVKS